MISTGNEGGNDGNYFAVAARNSDSVVAALDPVGALIPVVIAR